MAKRPAFGSRPKTLLAHPVYWTHPKYQSVHRDDVRGNFVDVDPECRPVSLCLALTLLVGAGGRFSLMGARRLVCVQSVTPSPMHRSLFSSSLISHSRKTDVGCEVPTQFFEMATASAKPSHCC
mmetsp:Transcript_20254/g.46902  ORF Transcript_20254/g.46902 Transcript_20254/m.46902 type:complete len:124 (+) Transcript_20254:139-510(+)